MRILFVFDSIASEKFLNSIKSTCSKNDIDLFPLTSDKSVIEETYLALQAMNCNSITQQNTALLINEQVDQLRAGICKWSADLGEAKVGNKKLKEWFVLPGCNVSTWWLGLLSEKNNLKTNAFLKIAQTNAVLSIISAGKYDLCITTCCDADLLESINKIARYNNVIIIKAKNGHKGKGLMFSIKVFLKNIGLAGEILKGLYVWLRFITRAYWARKVLNKQRSKRIPEQPSCLFVSYFPAIDKEKYQKGVFYNKYAYPLQEKMRDLNLPVVWLLMYVMIDGYSYKDALKIASSLAANGEKLFILEEYFVLRDALKSIVLWGSQVIKSLILFRAINKKFLQLSPIGAHNLNIVKKLWDNSFSGNIGMDGIVYYFMFKRVFKTMNNINNCIYYCEMHAWEKDLVAALKSELEGIQTIGFQHTSVPINYFSYFHDKSELVGHGRADDLPLPDIIACSGKLPHSLLADSGYQQLITVEAVRQMYIRDVLNLPIRKKHDKPVLLIAGSIDRIESTALIRMADEAFSNSDSIELWFKGHPSMALEGLFEEIDIKYDKSGYVICHNDISHCLEGATAVLVPSSTVAIEALSYGCEVIIPIFADSMNLNPLIGFEGYYHLVTSPEELNSVMESIANGCILHNLDEYREFVRNYWLIDPLMPEWEDLLSRDNRK